MRHILLKSDSNHEKSGSLFRQALFSYATILLLPILICSFYYIHSYNAVKERTRANQRLILENAGKQVDSVLRDAINLGSHLQLNQYVSTLSGQRTSLQSSPAMDRYYLKKTLASLQVSNALLDQISIYFPLSDYIVSTSSTYERSLLPYMEEKASTLTEQDWENILLGLEDARILCYANPAESFVAIAQPLLSTPPGEPLSVLVIQISKKELTGILQGRLLLDYPCTFSLIRPEGPLLSDGDAREMLSSLSCEDILSFFSENETALLYETAAPQRLVIDCYETLLPRAALISVATRRSFRSETTRLLGLLLLTILCCLLVGLSFVIYYSRKSYAPIFHIMRFLKAPGELSGPEREIPDADGNEYHYIMKRLIANRDELARQRESLKNNYLQKILAGEIPFSQISRQAAAQLSLDLPTGKICVVLLSVRDAQDVHGLSNLTCFIVRNVFEELLLADFAGSSFCVQEQKIAVLICVPEALSRPEHALLSAAERLTAFLADSFSLSVNAGISECLTKEQAADAWVQADAALEYRRLFETGPICFYASLPQKQIIGAVPLNTSEYVINLVTNGSAQQIREYFDAIKKELSRRELSLNDAKSCYYFFYQATAKLQLHCQSAYGDSLSCLDFLSEDFFAQSLPGVLSQTCSAYLSAAGELSRRSQDNAHTRWGADVRRFIDNNYFDANLNLNSIAGHFQVSPSWLSRKFRDEYQKSVIDYLYEIRISNSLPLLADTDLKVADIAQMCGFVDSNAFIRIFKKYKGTTPGRYKERLTTS